MCSSVSSRPSQPEWTTGRIELDRLNWVQFHPGALKLDMVGRLETLFRLLFGGDTLADLFAEQPNQEFLKGSIHGRMPDSEYEAIVSHIHDAVKIDGFAKIMNQ